MLERLSTCERSLYDEAFTDDIICVACQNQAIFNQTTEDWSANGKIVSTDSLCTSVLFFL